MGEELVNPSRYLGAGGMECKDALLGMLGGDAFVDHCNATAIEYLWRWRSKGGVADLEKARIWIGFGIDAINCATVAH